MGAISLVPSGLLPNAASALLLVSSRGMAIDFDSLRAAIRIWQQRITPFDCEHALAQMMRPVLVPTTWVLDGARRSHGAGTTRDCPTGASE